jgi:hypothetical protein
MVILVFLPGKNEYIKKQNERCTVYMNNGPVKNAWSHLRMVRAIGVFPVFRLLTDFFCLLTYEFCLSLWKIARCSVILLLPLYTTRRHCECPHQYMTQHHMLNLPLPLRLKGSVVAITAFLTILGQIRYNRSQHSTL